MREGWDSSILRFAVVRREARRSGDFLYTDSLPFGTGSNDLSLDRGQTGDGRIVHFERVGTEGAAGGAESDVSVGCDGCRRRRWRCGSRFRSRCLVGLWWRLRIASGAVLVDATDFFLRDVHGVAETLTQKGQGEYKVDPMRSAIALDGTKVFPKNTEVEAVLTFVPDKDKPPTGQFVKDVTPDPHALTVREHQSFLELPGPGFVARRYDPRAGIFSDELSGLYSAPLGGALDQQFIVRHRLVKKDAGVQGEVRGGDADSVLRGPGGSGTDTTRRLWMERGGGMRRSRRRDGPRGRSRWTCCRRMQTRWTCGTTSSSGCIGIRVGGAMGR